MTNLTTPTTAGSPAGSGVPNFTLQLQTIYDAAYAAAQPPAIINLMTYPQGSTQRIQQAEVLASQGYTIDLQIMVWGGDPFTTMLLRKMYGYTHVPSLGQVGVAVAPGLFFPGQPAYDPNVIPPGSILVITDPALLIPFATPPPSTTGTSEPCNPVGPLAVGALNMYTGSACDQYPNGATTGLNGIPADPRGTFVKNVTMKLMGPSGYWTLTVPAKVS